MPNSMKTASDGNVMQQCVIPKMCFAIKDYAQTLSTLNYD